MWVIIIIALLLGLSWIELFSYTEKYEYDKNGIEPSMVAIWWMKITKRDFYQLFEG